MANNNSEKDVILLINKMTSPCHTTQLYAISDIIKPYNQCNLLFIENTRDTRDTLETPRRPNETSLHALGYNKTVTSV